MSFEGILDWVMTHLNEIFLGLLIVLLVSILCSALIGLKKGIWKASYRMIFMFSLILIAFLTLPVFTDFLSSFDISPYYNGGLTLSRSVGSETLTYYVPFTSIKDIVTELIKGSFTLFNVSVTEASATTFALAIVDSVLKIAFFLVDIILIVTLGNLFCFIMWHLVFKRFVPKIAQKLVKFRWIAAIENAVTYLALLILFFTPFTSIINSVNQAYQRNRPENDDEIVTYVGNFLDAYNNSLFAQICFNWTVDDSGMTFDARLFDQFTTGVSGDATISLFGEIVNLTDLMMIAVGGMDFGSDNPISNPTSFITQDIWNTVFDTVGQSGLLTTVLPLVAEIALNSDLLAESDIPIPVELLNISDFDWKNEISNIQEMGNYLFEAGIVDLLFVEGEGGIKTLRDFEAEDAILSLVEDIVYSEDFNSILEIFRVIDDSKLFSRAIPVLLNMALESDSEGKIKEYLPLTWEQLNETSWGYECYVLFDFFHEVAVLDEHFLEAIFVQAGLNNNGGEEGEEEPAGEGEEEIPTLTDLISEHVNEFSELLVGKFNDEGELENVDKFGHTVVFDEEGERIEGRNYCLFDMNLLEYVVPHLMTNLFDLEQLQDLAEQIGQSYVDSYEEAVSALNVGDVLVNYKTEFHAILGVVSSIASNKELLEALIGGGGFESLMTEEGNFFSIEKKNIESFQTALSKMDESTLLYNILTPMLKSLLTAGDTADQLGELGLDVNIVATVIDRDMNKDREDRTFFTDLSSLFDSWDDLSVLSDLMNDGEGEENDIFEKLKDKSKIDALVSVLTIIYENPIFNPTPEEGDTFAKNENVYGLLGYVFDMTADMGLVVPRQTLEEVNDWPAEFEAFGDIIYYVTSHNLLNAVDLFADGLNRDAINKLRGPGEGHVDLPGFLGIVDESYIFSTRLGPFLDDMFGDALTGFLIDPSNNVSFSNVTDWKAEGQKIGNLLDSLYELIPEDEGEAEDFLSNFDIGSFTNVLELNKMLHELANSGVFSYIDEENVAHYQFGKWLYSKIDTSMSAFAVGDTSFDLLADPTPEAGENWDWNPDWGNRPDDPGTDDPYFASWHDKFYDPAKKTHYISYRDFISPEGIDETDYVTTSKFWCNYELFVDEQLDFIDSKGWKLDNPQSGYFDNAWEQYFADPDFIADYETCGLFDTDEISRVVKFMTYAMRLLQKDASDNSIAFDSMDTDLMGGLLTAVNDTTCLRMAIYNLYLIAGSDMLSGYSSFSLGSANNVYMVDANADINDFDTGRPARQDELDLLINFYGVINDAKTDGFLSGGSFDYTKMNDEDFVADMKEVLTDLNNSFVFHRAGPTVDGQLTTFQTLFDSMLGQSEMKDIIYIGNDSPKDKVATEYSSATEKVTYLVKNTFLTDDDALAKGVDIGASLIQQGNEITSLMDAIKQVYSLKDSGGNTVTNFASADMTKAENIEIIEDLFGTLNNSGLLYDCVPNTLYNMLIKNNQLSISNGGLNVEFNRVDPFYHYYYNGSVLRGAVDWEASYSTNDISNIITIIQDYQNFNSLLAGGDISNPATLSALLGVTDPNNINGPLPELIKHMYSSNLFHTPARNYAGVYYTDKFDGDGFTLFEELIDKVCTFVKLDTFAYDASYDVGYVDAAAKLRAKVKLITRADDDNLEVGDVPPYYHNEVGEAWAGVQGEIDSIMLLADEAISLDEGSATLDLSTFKFDEISPTKVESLLHCINNSDLISDAVPHFLKEGFDALGIDSLLSYSGTNYAYYRLGQGVYGGDAVGGTEKGEISTLCNTMLDLYDEGTGAYATGITNFTSLATGGQDDYLEAILRLVYNSRILNTSVDGVYDEYNVIETHNVSAQGIMLYNSIGTTLCNYIAYDADESTPAKTAIEKMAVLSKIAHMREYVDETEVHDTPAVEAQGLMGLITSVEGNIDASTFDGRDTDTIKAKKALILAMVESAYNAESAINPVDYRRSAIVSEFVSGLFNTILENQYYNLANDPAKYPSYAYNIFSFGEDDATALTFASYSGVNVTERDGLEGLLDSLDYIKNFAAVLADPAQVAALRDCFTKMGSTNGNNSEIATVLYLTEAHSYFEVLGLSPLKWPTMFVPVDETIKDPGLGNNVYSDTFCFDEYGQRVEDYANA